VQPARRKIETQTFLMKAAPRLTRSIITRAGGAIMDSTFRRRFVETPSPCISTLPDGPCPRTRRRRAAGNCYDPQTSVFLISTRSRNRSAPVITGNFRVGLLGWRSAVGGMFAWTVSKLKKTSPFRAGRGLVSFHLEPRLGNGWPIIVSSTCANGCASLGQCDVRSSGASV